MSLGSWLQEQLFERRIVLVTDGPFVETKELWTGRFPNPGGTDGEIEVRQLFELDDFGPSEAVDRFREMGLGTKK